MIQQLLRSHEIALDIGHSSIGWAVFQNGEKFDLLGTGVVLFPADDCLAIKRRAYRRQRRHVRATRYRIQNLKKLLLHVGVLSEAELNQPGCAWPWKLAAEVLSGNGRILSWPELWDVLRWYAHNRGYDGNARWSGDESQEDTDKVEAAKNLMDQYAKKTMAETFCAALDISPLGVKKSSQKRFKGLGVAFQRPGVIAEVKTILEKHVGILPHMSSDLIHALAGNDNYHTREWDDDAWRILKVPAVTLPNRYKGSYLFGQSVPRFNNRIISSCPVTYAKILNEELAAGVEESEAKKKATRNSKVPAKGCPEFLLYRWAMIMANLTVNDGKNTRTLTPEERKAIHQVMVKKGHLNQTQLKKALEVSIGNFSTNIDAYFLTPNAAKALCLRPDKKQLPDGRAPYTREVMKAAIKDVFDGKHPTEKGNSLYLSEEIKQAQLHRELEEKTNNHLVRHRVLITRRLVKDIIKDFAGNESSRIGKITVEVNRDLQAFSGMTNKEIEGELNQMMKDHTSVVKELEKDFSEAGKSFPITAGLIRKARIATDMGWKCPYTGKDYDALDLVSGAYDKDHIIPRSLRPSDSLDSLVITSRAINEMKGKRTGLQFIKEFAGKDIEGELGVGKQKPNLFNEKQYKDFVARLDIKTGHKQDKERKKNRAKLLELEKYEEKTFLPKDLAQTSHLVRLAASELEKEFSGLEDKPRIVSLPGSVTGEVRKSWKLYGCLAAHNPEVQKLLERKEKEPELNIKKELRDLTHLHHALDACVIGYASHYLPNEGGIWEILVKRNRRPEEIELLLSRNIFSRDSEGRANLRGLNPEIKQQITDRLKECRVVQHIPKRMDGLSGLEENTRGIVSIEVPDLDAAPDKKSKGTKLKEIWNNQSGNPLPVLEDLTGVVVHLRQFSARDPKNHDKRARKPTDEKASKLLGLCPDGGEGKLRAIKGVRVLTTNFGLALWRKNGKPDGEVVTRMILGYKVWPQLKAIAEKENGGKWPQVLRNGHIIHVPQGQSNYQGYWQIASIKNNEDGLYFDMLKSDMTKLRNKVSWAKINVSVKTLIKSGMTAVKSSLTGAFTDL